jgi:histidinol-phosphate/aromatic aminotransferase/cobyric acid decarboxylase-like protein
VVPERRQRICDVRSEVFSFLDRHKFRFVPSVSNCFMLDVGQPGVNIVMAMRKEKVYIGRVWPSWPTHVRVTVGTAAEMAKFQAALLKVMG